MSNNGTGSSSWNAWQAFRRHRATGGATLARQTHRLAVITILAVVSTVVVVSPVSSKGSGATELPFQKSAADESESSGLVDDDSDHGILTGENDGSGGDGNAPIGNGLVDTEGPLGPVGFTDAPTYEVIRGPGEVVPSQIKVLIDDEHVNVVTAESKDIGSFVTLLVIDSAEAATEYRFDNVVPSGHTANLMPDGSIEIVDADGEEAGYISAPWAYDSGGSQVPTSYRIEGDTLVQTVEHEGASYPVLADPSWWDTAATFVGAAAAGAGLVCLVTVCAPAVVATIAVAGAGSSLVAVSSHIATSSSGGSGRGSPTNTCNMRNRSGC